MKRILCLCVAMLMFFGLSAIAMAEESTVSYMRYPTYSVVDTDVYLVKIYPREKTIVELPDAATNSGRRLVIKTLYNAGVNSLTPNVMPLFVSKRPRVTILPDVAGKWAELVSNGRYWVIMAGN